MASKILHIVNTLTPTLKKGQGDIMHLMGLWLPFGRLFGILLKMRSFDIAMI